MKQEIDDLEKTYRVCLRQGKLKTKEIDVELIRSKKSVSEKGVLFIVSVSKNISKNSTDWTFVFRDHYEALRGLIEAILLFDGIEADNHQCANAYICFKHKGLEIDWEFLESVRLIRNAINYRGKLLTFQEFNPLKISFDLHMRSLCGEIEKLLKLHDADHSI